MADNDSNPFASANLQRHVDEMLETAPPTKGGQAEVSVTTKGASVDVGANVGRRWTGALTAGWWKEHGWGFAAKARKVWGGQ